jgi:hypothetical protein
LNFSSIIKSGTTKRKREYTRKGGGKGWFTLTLIIEFCKLKHQLATTLRQNSRRNMGTPQQEKRVYEKGGRERVVHHHPHH